MKLVYIAGPFRAPTQWQIAENVREAERWGLRVAELGVMPLIPHANTAHFHGLLTEQFWIDGTIELLKRCDGALFLPTWVKSAGARAEHAWCEGHGVEIFYGGHLVDELDELSRWARGEARR